VTPESFRWRFFFDSQTPPFIIKYSSRTPRSLGSRGNSGVIIAEKKYYARGMWGGGMWWGIDDLELCSRSSNLIFSQKLKEPGEKVNSPTVGMG
jgi:hypothetical protein